MHLCSYFICKRRITNVCADDDDDDADDDDDDDDEAGVITRTTFGRPAPKKLGRPKNVQISARFLTTFGFDRNISGTDRHIEHLKKLDQPLPLPRWEKKYGSTNKKVLVTHIDEPK